MNCGWSSDRESGRRPSLLHLSHAPISMKLRNRVLHIIPQGHFSRFLDFQNIFRKTLVFLPLWTYKIFPSPELYGSPDIKQFSHDDPISMKLRTRVLHIIPQAPFLGFWIFKIYFKNFKERK